MSLIDEQIEIISNLKMPIIDNIVHGPPLRGIPDVPVGQYILDRLQKSPVKIVSIYPKYSKLLTNHELLESSVRLASALEKRGVKVGDTLAISSENIPNWFVAVCATIYLGATIAPMNPTYLQGEIRHCLNISRPKIIFVSKTTEAKIKETIKSLSWKIELIQLENSSVNNIDTIQDILESTKDLIVVDPYKFKAVSLLQANNREQEAVILYSSGTTGLPKGVMLSHHNLLLAIFFFQEHVINNCPFEIIPLVFLPFFHGYGFSLTLSAILAGLTSIIIPSFEPILFCELIHKYKISLIPLVPPVLVFLSKHPLINEYDFTSVKEILCGAAPLSKQVKDDVVKRFKNRIQIRHGYGMTELSVVVCLSSREDNDKGGETIGKLGAGTSCKIIEPATSKTLEAYQIGELCFKGDHVMLGYRSEPAATAQTISSDGWLYSGDLGYYDTDGYLFITGRLKELIKYKGFQVSPAEIENILLSHPDVEDAAVVGRYNEEAGQVPVAFVVKKNNANLTPQQLRLFVDEQVSPQKRLRGGVHFVKSIPKSAAGKILRKELEQIVSKL